MSIPKATADQLASQHRIEQRAAALLDQGSARSSYPDDVIRAAATYLDGPNLTTGDPDLDHALAELLDVVADELDPDEALPEVGRVAVRVAELVMGVLPS